MDFGSPVSRAELYRGIWEPRPADVYNQPKGWDQRMVAAETAATLRSHAPATPQMMANAPLTPPSDNDTVPSPRTSPISPASQQNQEKSLPNESENVEQRRSISEVFEQAELYKRLQQQYLLAQEQNNNSMDSSSSLPKEHLKRLENMVLPTSSTEDSCSGSENGKSPPTGSSKQKTFKCKQCGHISDTKVESYRHNKIHLRPDKILICKICEFCTEFKHHFEYHMRNHEGTKPFKCDQCSYSCVNRSMLTSHQKSHSSVYQYRCKTCGYSAKYMHALKQHLKKNDHEPGLVLNPDGTVNPYPIIDVYGSRRGPRKTSNSPKTTTSPIGVPLVGASGIFPMSQEQFSMAVAAQFRFRQLLEQAASNAIQNGAIGALPPTEALSREHASAFAPESQSPPLALSPQEAVDTATLQRPRGTEVLDLSRWKPEVKQERETDEEEEEEDEEKEIALKCEKEAEMTDDEEMLPSMYVEANYVPMSPRGGGMCKHCNIQFGNMIMHQIHMGYHSHGNPLVCNKCGHSFGDSIQFFSHIGMSCKPSQS